MSTRWHPPLTGKLRMTRSVRSKWAPKILKDQLVEPPLRTSYARMSSTGRLASCCCLDHVVASTTLRKLSPYSWVVSKWLSDGFHVLHTSNGAGRDSWHPRGTLEPGGNLCFSNLDLERPRYWRESPEWCAFLSLESCRELRSLYRDWDRWGKSMIHRGPANADRKQTPDQQTDTTRAWTHVLSHKQVWTHYGLN